MKSKFAFCLFLAIVLFQVAFASTNNTNFVSVDGRNFKLNGKKYFFLGANYWYGMNLGAPKAGNLTRLKDELDQLEELGVKNLRIMGSTQGPDTKSKRIVPSLEYDKGKYNDDIWEGLDIFLYEMGKRDMKAVVTLNNFWEWSGGFPQYYEWFTGKYELDPYHFYSNKEMTDHLKEFITLIVNRKNTAYEKYDKKTVYYKDDPVIMAWQLANEPRGNDCKSWVNWVKDTSKHIKSLDSNHLVSIGTEGTITHCTDKGNKVSTIDYITVHAWAQNWGWYIPHNITGLAEGIIKARNYVRDNIEINKKRNKPLVLEEFGLARDSLSLDPESPTLLRDLYFRNLFQFIYDTAIHDETISGANFWAFGGQGRPATNHSGWIPGDDFLGDPAHESQGWYSIYDKDNSTLDIIREFTQKFDHISS